MLTALHCTALHCTALRFGLHYRLDHSLGVAREGWAIIDLPHAFHQMGVDLFARCSEGWKVEKKQQWIGLHDQAYQLGKLL